MPRQDACNYVPTATIASTCQYPDVIGVCGGNCLSDENDNGICDGFEASIFVELDTAFYGQQNAPSGNEDAYADLAGYKSFVVYAVFQNPYDVLSALFADNIFFENTPPLAIDAPCGCWNPDEASMVIGPTINPAFDPFFPLLKYDSFWTIGKLYDTDPGQAPSWTSYPVLDVGNLQLAH